MSINSFGFSNFLKGPQDFRSEMAFVKASINIQLVRTGLVKSVEEEYGPGIDNGHTAMFVALEKELIPL